MGKLSTKWGLLVLFLVSPASVQSQSQTSEHQTCLIAIKTAMDSKSRGVLTRVQRHSEVIKRLDKKCHRILKKLAPKATALPAQCSQAAESNHLNKRAAKVIQRMLTEIKTRRATCAKLIVHLGKNN